MAKRSTPKKIVFISHITEEASIAAGLKTLIDTAFLGMIDVFVSSSEESIPAGDKWLDKITAALRDCSVLVLICSPDSIRRPWLNFEAGAGWVREIPVVPICHSGLSPGRLPAPLSLLQGVRATDPNDMRRFLPTLSAAIGAESPSIEFDEFISVVSGYELDRVSYIEDGIGTGSGSSGSEGIDDGYSHDAFQQIAGQWRLDFAAGAKNRAGWEVVDIDELGRYFVVHRVLGNTSHQFNLHVDDFDEERRRITFQKVSASDYVTRQREVLQANDDWTVLEGYAEHDNHRLIYKKHW